MSSHSAATQLGESGVDIRFVQRLLGHASLYVAMIYTHVSDQSVHRAITEANFWDAYSALAIDRRHGPSGTGGGSGRGKPSA